jgi:hypothetical protein
VHGQVYTPGLQPIDAAFDANGRLYLLTSDGGSLTAGQQVWRDNLAGGLELVAGSGAAWAGVFPADGAAATSGPLGEMGGLDFDATGKLLLACTQAHRVAEVDVTAGTIRTLTGFGFPADSTEELVQPLATAVFTNIASLQTDAAGRPYIGGQQVKRIGA